jgi:hypothetical protein
MCWMHSTGGARATSPGGGCVRGPSYHARQSSLISMRHGGKPRILHCATPSGRTNLPHPASKLLSPPLNRLLLSPPLCQLPHLQRPARHRCSPSQKTRPIKRSLRRSAAWGLRAIWSDAASSTRALPRNPSQPNISRRRSADCAGKLPAQRPQGQRLLMPRCAVPPDSAPKSSYSAWLRISASSAAMSG